LTSLICTTTKPSLSANSNDGGQEAVCFERKDRRELYHGFEIRAGAWKSDIHRLTIFSHLVNPRRSPKVTTTFPFSQRNELKYSSSKPFAALHASGDPSNVRKSSPAIPCSLKPSAPIQQKDTPFRPVTPDVQDGLVSAKPIFGYETTKAIQAALVVSFSLHISIIFLRFPFSRLFLNSP